MRHARQPHRGRSRKRLTDQLWLAATLAYFAAGDALAIATLDGWIRWTVLAVFATVLGQIAGWRDRVHFGRHWWLDLLVYPGAALAGLAPRVLPLLRGGEPSAWPAELVIAVTVLAAIYTAACGWRRGDRRR